MEPHQKLKGFTLRFIYAQLRLIRALGLSPGAEKLMARPLAQRKANRPPAFANLPMPPEVKTELRTIQGRSGPLEIKTYLPPKLDPTMPRVFFLHGGGWVTGDVHSLDHTCAEVCLRAQCMIVSAEYRLAPEATLPGPLEDCDDGLNWTLSDSSLGPLPAAGLVIMGESAGGNLAAALCVLRARQGNSPIRHQILIYPALDATLTSGSMQSIDQPGLELGEMKKVLDAYRGKFDIKDPLLSPLFAENIAQLPPALILTADIDPLRDDGATFARKLQAAGVRARHINYLGMPHGFFFIPKVCPPAFEGIAEITAELKSLAV